MDFKVPKHNTPAITLIKNYQNKKSGKVTVSRREIQQRFNGMEWRHQKMILLAFINASDSDREWASRKMFAFWDKSFIPVVRSLWEQNHEVSLSWLILRYFPKDYLKQNMACLSKGRNYYYLCQRLIDEEDFIIDKERIYESDMIELFKIMKKPVSDEEISDVFFSMITKICKGEYRSSYMYKWYTEGCDNSDVSILCNCKVSNILFDIEYVLDRRILAEKIRMWNSIVMRDFRDSNEFRMIKQMGVHGHDALDTYMAMLKKYYLKHLNTNNLGDEEESFDLTTNQIVGQKMDLASQKTFLNNIKMENPAVENLLTSLSLELVESLSF